MFVTIEGIEGSGKSTLQRGLIQHFSAGGTAAFATREPGGTVVGDAVRALFLDPATPIAALTEALLVNAARAQHVIAEIGPRLARGEVVVCDRFVDSTLAYQGYGRGLDLAMLQHLCTIATGGLQPDCTLVLDLDVERARARLAGRGGEADRIETEATAFHARVRRGFLDLARGARYAVLDAGVAPELLLQHALAEIDRRAAERRG